MISLDVMKSRAGVYVVIATNGRRQEAGLVEVDAAGRVFQLELQSGRLDRDGELPPDGWNVDALQAIHGPFERSQIATLRLEWPPMPDRG